jgi:hypothetical protein
MRRGEPVAAAGRGKRGWRVVSSELDVVDVVDTGNIATTSATEPLESSHAPYIARLTSISLCRQHTDLTCYQIADLHQIPNAGQSHASVERLRANDPDYRQRYQQLRRHAQQLRQQAGLANANLKRGLMTQHAA